MLARGAAKLEFMSILPVRRTGENLEVCRDKFSLNFIKYDFRVSKNIFCGVSILLV